MANEDDRRDSARAPVGTEPKAQELKGAIDSGLTGDKVAYPDPGAAPLGTDDEAAGTPDTAARVRTALRQEVGTGRDVAASRLAGREHARPVSLRPKSPNIQIYRPQLTSVLSILNRVTGLILSLCAIALVIWLTAAAAGPRSYQLVQIVLLSWFGQIALLVATFAFFLHLCGGIRHLVWDTVHGFELRAIYISGWMVVVASVLLTTAAWVISFWMRG